MFGAAAQCAPRLPISLRILGCSVAVTSRALRIVSLTVYAIIAVPVLNVVILGGIMVASAWVLSWGFKMGTLVYLLIARGLEQRLEQQPLPPLFSRMLSSLLRTILGHWSLYLLLGANVAIVVDTEAMITRTKPFVKPGESEWTFGQTLALLLLSLPLLELIRSLARQPREEALRSFVSLFPREITRQRLGDQS